MTSDSQFNAIRPYIGEEIPAAVERLSQAEEFLALFLPNDKGFVKVKYKNN